MRQALQPRTLLLGLLAAAFAVLVVQAARSPGRLTYDEPYFANYVALLHEHGLSRAFLRSLSGTAGPLYAFVQAAFEPLTALSPPGMRLVNVGLLATAAALLFAMSRHDRPLDRLASAASVLVVPMTWVLAGMALSEMPALVFATLSLGLLLKGLQRVGEPQALVGWFLASAVCLAVAAWGRQPYLLLAAVPAVLATVDARLRLAAVVFAGVVLAMVVPLFVIWGGLTPPSHHFVQEAPTLKNGLVSLGYAGFALLLLVPGMAWQHRRLLLAVLVVVTVANFFLAVWTIHPLRWAVERLLPGPFFLAYGTFCGALALTSSLATLAFICHAIWKGRADCRQLAITVGLLCMCVWPAVMGANFSSRYMAMGLPYLMLAVEPMRDWNMRTVLGAALGCAAGAVALFGYYHQ
jgi:hypothetical protein